MMRGHWALGLGTVIAVAAALGGGSVSGCSANTRHTAGSGQNGAATSGSASGAGQSGSGGGLSVGVGAGTGGGGGSKMPPPCDTSCQKAGGSCNDGVCVLSEDPGGVSAQTQASLKAGGKADSGFRWLYPYDKTVFPRGLLPPVLQFDGQTADAVLLQVSFGTLQYQGFYKGTNNQVQPSANTWDAIVLAAHATDAVKVQLTKSSGGQVTGPITETWSVAPGSLRGTIYYETYASKLQGGAGGVGIMKISPGATQPTVLKSGCGNVCHTASADGSTLVSATGFLTNSISYDLKNNAAPIKLQPDQSFTYGGIYPDGSFLVSATNYRTSFGTPSHVYDTHSGAQIPTPSWDDAVQHAGTPAFSPDGTMFAFNHEDSGQGHSIAVMNYDKASKAFSGLTDIAQDPGTYLGWPAFTPDSKWVVYHAGSNDQFETDSNASGDLYIVNVASHSIARLDAADGYAGGNTYLPAQDPQLNFAPTVLPEAVGGYFWMVFTSHRSYGNTLQSKDPNGSDQNGKLWVAALDLKPQAGKDASHPAFYLDGQEADADNLRGFWVLDPCKKNGENCLSGDQCCGGYCYEVNGMLQCNPTPNGCSKQYDKCEKDSDCCDPGAQCINGHCADINPQ